MERLLRLGGQSIGGMGSQSPETSQNDTAEQVNFFFKFFMNMKVYFEDSYFVSGTFENDETRSCWCSL